MINKEITTTVKVIIPNDNYYEFNRTLEELKIATGIGVHNQTINGYTDIIVIYKNISEFETISNLTYRLLGIQDVNYNNAISKLPTITKDIVIGDCKNCIHRIESDDCDSCGYTTVKTWSGHVGYPILQNNDNGISPPTTGCPQKQQTYIFNFVENTFTE